MDPSATEISHNQQKDLFLACAFIYILLSGGWGLLYSSFPYGIIIVGLCLSVVYFLRAPFPSERIVREFFGIPLHEEESTGFKMKSVAHRGAGFDAPENSIAAFNLSKENGFEAIECDVTLTSDGVPIMFHDDTMERLANRNINVNTSTWEEIKNVDISETHPFKARFLNTTVPTLDDAVKQMIENGQRIFIDMKKPDIRLVPVILNLYSRYPQLYKLAAITTFYPQLVYLIRRQNPKIIGCCAWRPYYFSHTSFNYTDGLGPVRYKEFYWQYPAYLLDIIVNWALPRITYYFVGLSAVLLHRDAISGESIVYWRNKGVRVICWSVNTPTEKHFWARHLKITYLTDTATGENSTHQISS